MSKTAIILGATGLTGGILLHKLLKDDRYAKIKLFSRSSVKLDHPKIEEHLIDMFNLRDHSTSFTADEVFCCVGTTKSKTPDKEKYHNVDYGIPVSAARLCKTNGINTLIVVSALGANANSAIFYNRTKGEMEKVVLEFNIPNTYILQPSLIDSKRQERRIGEYLFIQLMRLINPVLVGKLRKYRSIEPETIVSVMIWVANNKYSPEIIPSDKINQLADN
ncbi:MAG: nucleoside-diphosphate sugar epimerase [Aquimarina sp.]|nr:nucleoside-diphosphate sugar epimerase [Aquimarina sp.]